ncbi:odorant receptor 49b-like [Odontomachus brunneus]|uniref:odorant receptor 49b-like n=1 Tax=Odontomachus brunneus TaxID=486640 RepID=UPI0013F2A772|nr:odorant receptor 49b-like [Odontomachus brunneus]
MVSDKSFASVIRVNMALLRFSGVVPCEGDAKNVQRLRNLQNVLSVVAYSCILTYSVVYTLEFILYTVHLDTWMESFAMILSIVGGQMRFTILLLFRSRFHRLLNLSEELWLTLSASEQRCVRDRVRATRRLTYYYLFGCAFTIFFYAVASLFIGQHSDSANITVIRTLPYACPFEVHRTPYYEIMYAMQLCSMTNVGLTCAAADTIGPVLVLTMSGHFKVLNSRIQRLCESDPAVCKLQRTEKACQAGRGFLEVTNEEEGALRSNRTVIDLEACVRYHQTMFEFHREVGKLTGGIFLMQLIPSTYNISLVGFKLAGDDPDKFKYISQVAIAVIQLFLCNWPADVLRTESEAIAKASYFTSWYHFPYRLKRSLNIITIRSQKPAQLSAYFIPLSLETFASMVSSAVSFFTMMRSIN